MADPSKPTILQSGIDAVSQFTGAIPPGKKGALVLAYDKKGTVPWVRVGVAAKVVDTERLQWTVGSGIEARAKERPTIGLYSLWTW